MHIQQSRVTKIQFPSRMWSKSMHVQESDSQVIDMNNQVNDPLRYLRVHSDQVKKQEVVEILENGLDIFHTKRVMVHELDFSSDFSKCILFELGLSNVSVNLQTIANDELWSKIALTRICQFERFTIQAAYFCAPH
jgi:hypothetical protein